MESSVQELIERSERLQQDCALLQQQNQEFARRNRALYLRNQELHRRIEEVYQRSQELNLRIMDQNA